jgi:hypothetical protein
VRPAALKVLVPDGADSLIACRYGLGTSNPSGTSGLRLTAAGHAGNAAEITRITDGLDAIKPSRHVICPDFEVLGGETVTFFYRSGPSVILTVNLGGCLQISNGHLTRPGIDAPVLSEIQALLRPVKAPS